MAKKFSFDNLPEMVGRIYEILTAEGSDHTALPEIIQRMTRVEKKIDHLEKVLSPDRPVMDMQAVCKVLKLRPKAVNELAMSGVLLSHSEGRKTLFYEDDVVRFYMMQPAWRSLLEKSESEKPAAEPVGADAATMTDGRQRIDIDAAAEILGRSTAAIYQLARVGNVPHHKDGRKTYFYADELREWAKTHTARKRNSK